MTVGGKYRTSLLMIILSEVKLKFCEILFSSKCAVSFLGFARVAKNHA
jgi:hypothetical protein